MSGQKFASVASGRASSRTMMVSRYCDWMGSAAALPRLRCGMIDLEDVDPLRKLGAAERERIESRSEDHVLADSPTDRFVEQLSEYRDRLRTSDDGTIVRIIQANAASASAKGRRCAGPTRSRAFSACCMRGASPPQLDGGARTSTMAS